MPDPPHLAPATPPTARDAARRGRRQAPHGRDLIYFDDLDDPRPRSRWRAQPRPPPGDGDHAPGHPHRETGSPSPPPDRTALPAARRTRSARPADPTNPSEIPSHYDVAVFENRSPSFGPALSEATGDAPRHRPSRADSTTSRTPGPRSHPHERRPLRSRLLLTGAQRLVRHADTRTHGDRGVGRPHGGAVGAARRAAGVPVREPRRGDRCHAAAPARPDLLVSVHHPRTTRLLDAIDHGTGPLRSYPRVRAGRPRVLRGEH
jgi:UDPglucose--hexose-1-phosphate uridylyltransferase